MARGYRSAILAFGLVLAGASPQPSAKNQAEKHPSQSQPASSPKPLPIAIASPVDVVQPTIDAPPCGPDQYQAKDDLCAQWKAADAASDAAWWAMIGTLVAALGTAGLYWQIKLTREAVQDTGKATKAMERQNEIAENAQRAWVTLSAEPKLVIARGDGLHIRAEFVAENIGETVATHFNIESEYLFRGQDEKSEDFVSRIFALISEWKREYNGWPSATLLPGDKEVSSIWDDRKPPELRWWSDMVPGKRTAQVVAVAAVFYRTVGAPNMIQLSWRGWYFQSFKDTGERASWILEPAGRLEADELCVDPYSVALRHEEYPADHDNHRSEE